MKIIPLKSGRYNKSKLRDLSVLLAAYQILHMEDYELVQKITNEKDLNVVESTEQENHLILNVKAIELICLAVLKNNPIHKDDHSFFVEKSGLILESFFEGGIAERGISPHIAFVTLLFSNFAEYTGKKHDPEFLVFLNTKIYDAVFDLLENATNINWWDYYLTSIKSLSKGVGISLEVRLPPPAIPSFILAS